MGEIGHHSIEGQADVSCLLPFPSPKKTRRDSKAGDEGGTGRWVKEDMYESES